MPRRHGDTEVYLIDDEVIVPTPDLKDAIKTPALNGLTDSLKGLGFARTPAKDPIFHYGYMFRNPRLPEYRPSYNHLKKLGLALKLATNPQPTSQVPAGYIFLGQFIDHDLTFDATQRLSHGILNPRRMLNKRSPTLDLDSLYGREPGQVRLTPLGQNVYEFDRIKLRVGMTQADKAVSLPSAHGSYPNDLRRNWDPCSPRRAAIIDARNDENLAVAQTHVAFIRFHNAVVDALAKTIPRDQLFETAREQVVRFYQRIILEDYLPRIIDPKVLEYVLKNGCEYFVLSPGQEFMPVEFSVAAFRFGHSVLTENYEWNSVFQSDKPRPQPASLRDLFTFTEGGGLLAQKHLPSSWIIDWTRFYDFTHIPGVTSKKPASWSGRIGPAIASDLMNLAPIPNHGAETASLAARNLLRGRLLGLPSGQCVAELLGVSSLKPSDFKDEPHYELLRDFGFDRVTPLWYYILKEAKQIGNGERLGPVGSRIVAETFVGLIKASEINVFGPAQYDTTVLDNVKPGMAEMLVFVNNASAYKDFLNPV